MKLHHHYYSPLARRIGIYVILVSALITLFTSGIQIYSEYKRDIEGVHSRLRQLETTQLSNIASRVWVLDTVELERTLNALLELQSIEYIEIYDYDSLLMSAGKDIQKNALVVTHRLEYKHNNKVFDIGSIVIKASLHEVYSLIIRRAAIIVLSNGFKTFIVAAFILFIFYHLVGRHLIKIAQHTNNKEFLSADDDLELDRETDNKENDELDRVVSSINTMRVELQSQFKEISNQKHHLSLTLQSIGDAVITTDMQGCIIQMNPAAEKLTGWPLTDAKSQSLHLVFQIINNQTFEPVTNLVEILTGAHRTSNIKNSTVLFSRNGNEFHISYTATAIKDSEENNLGIVLIFHDITEQHNLREDIAKRKRDMQAIMDNSPSVIYIKDINGKYLFVNRRYEQVFSVTRESIIGKSDDDIFDKDIVDILKRNDDNVKRAGHAVELEETLRHPDGELHTYISMKFPLLDETGNIYAVCGKSTDITDRKVQENNLRRAQKMDALGKLTSGIAHDFNNMLGIILGYAQLLEATLADNPRTKNYASEIRKAGDRGAKLTKKLLDFSSQDAADATNTDINLILQEEQHMLEKTLTARIKLQMDLAKELWITHLDSGELEDAIVNMCINSMHAIEDKGTITIRTNNQVIRDKDVERLGLTSGEYVVLTIQDTGSGMDDDTKDRIFDPFYTTKGNKGTGLGLSQVYGFVERSSGAIEVISSPGNGTQFNLYFPRIKGVTQELDRNNVSDHGDKLLGSETILVVDDEPSLLNLVKDSLVLHGYNVLTASNGQEALEILNRDPIDLVITDIIMPKLDGTQLVAEVKNKYPSVKLQMVSGYADHRINKSIDVALAREILYKPFLMEELISRVHTLLDSGSTVKHM